MAEEKTSDGGSGRKEPEAHFVRYHTRDGRKVPVRPYIRGRGKPSLVFVTLLLALMIAALSLRAGM